MANNFFNDSNKVYSENLNDGILVGNAFDWTVNIGLPADSDDVFPASSDVVMAKVADVRATPNSNLSIGSTITNSSSSTQVYRLTVYPNFNRFGGFKSISITCNGNVTFYIANKGASTPIASGLDYTDLSNVPELKVLKEYDIVVSIPRNASVTGLSFVLQSKSASVSGSISQSNVSNLTGVLNEIDTRVSVLESADAGVFFYELTASDYNPEIDSHITLTCKCTDITGNVVSGKSLTLYRNGSSVGTIVTNSSGVGTWRVVCAEWGLIDYSVANVHCQVNVNGFKQVENYSSGFYTLSVDGSTRTARFSLNTNGSKTFNNGVSYEQTGFIPTEYLPPTQMFTPIMRNMGLSLHVRTNGTVAIYNPNANAITAETSASIYYNY